MNSIPPGWKNIVDQLHVEVPDAKVYVRFGVLNSDGAKYGSPVWSALEKAFNTCQVCGCDGRFSTQKSLDKKDVSYGSRCHMHTNVFIKDPTA